MHLKQLKLSGFKSFVDPTVVPFPGQLVAVVGPNGCGKSNIIDAVRWVLGESSAKNLRGESMADVIFNGSSHRKPVGQASIELVFDNSMGRLTGQYASYQEIAIKRVVTRDGESSYFLNGSRCRRRDITDIFLGTGAGAKGYSIIGQGTISRLIEARPEELRAFLEEAAGVSKYKERRRETLTRIEHTRENLARVADIRDELDKQLQRLERQAKAAERYKILKAEERLYRAEILALKWQKLTEEQRVKQTAIKQLDTDYEAHQARATDAYKAATDLREVVHQQNENLQQVQGQFYQLATEIARLEETIQQQQREKLRLKADQQQMQADWQQISTQVEQDKNNLESSIMTLESLQEQQGVLEADYKVQQQALEEKQAEQALWRAKTQEIQADLSRVLREKDVEQLRLQHVQQRRQDILIRLEKISDELGQGDIDGIEQDLLTRRDRFAQLKNQIADEEQIAQAHQKQGAELREQLAETEKALHRIQEQIFHLKAEQATLKSRQGLSKEQHLDDAWASKTRLLESIQVEKEWQLACELVLADGLQGIALTSLDSVFDELSTLQGSAAVFLSQNQQRPDRGSVDRLADKIKGYHPNWLYPLDKIFTAQTLDEALIYHKQLAVDESVITPQGLWLGFGWIKCPPGEAEDESGTLARQEALVKTAEALIDAEQEQQRLRELRDSFYQGVKESELTLEQARRNLAETSERSRGLDTEIKQIELALEQAASRKNTLSGEYTDLGEQLEELVIQHELIETRVSQSAKELVALEENQQGLLQSRQGSEEALDSSRTTVDHLRTAFHQSQMQVDREKIKSQQISETIARETARLETLVDRLEAMAQRLHELETPDASYQTVLNEKLVQHTTMEEQVKEAREALTRFSSELEASDALVRSEEALAKTIQEQIQQEKMQEQALAVRAGGILESMEEMDSQVDQVLAALPSGIDQLMREASLADIIDKIKRLGAINLAAIEEYEVESQRKNHLDAQYQDLTDALATLDAAIEKMDKETQQRLQTTFDEVNAAFQALFPRLFGGGRAMLELTSDNLLEAGIVVMAQPPGKRNSTIHLLSGGEKAMTAVALVFAIFQLNPSPFCMLDEVDAPLDDANVRRFCALVKEMSQFVQFLFITHNKVTMELADHLIGVTMREPGVSRVVAVDVEEALLMTEA